MLTSKFVKFLMPTLKRQADSSANFVFLFSFMKDNSSVLFLTQTIYTLLKRSLSKWNFLILLSAQVKICPIPDVSLETSSRFLSKFCIPLQFYKRSFLCTFFSWNNISFSQKEPMKVEIFETFRSSGQNLSNSWCQFLNGKSIRLQILYPSSVSWKITLLYYFSSNSIHFAQKEHIKMKIFETFKCSDQNLSNSSCQFWNK